MCLGALATVLRVWDDEGVPMAEVERDGRTETVTLIYVPEARPGDSVLIHIGFPVQVLDPVEAAEARALRAEMGA
jgi:hydrogenase expression/formation protein HypC